MPVFGTPADSGGTPAVTATQPVVTNLYEIPLPEKMRSVASPQGECGTVRLQLLDSNGDPVDLAPLAVAPYTIQLSFREYVNFDPVCPLSWSLGQAETPTTSGWIHGAIPASVSNNPGIYLLQASVTDDTHYPRAGSDGEVVLTAMNQGQSYVITTRKLNSSTATYAFAQGVVPLVGINTQLTLGQQLVRNVCLVLANALYLVVERGLLGVPDRPGLGPPTLAEVRLHLRDFPGANRLLDDYEFDQAEVALAMVHCLDYYNEAPPPLPQRYDTRSFPFRYHWLEGIAGYLFQTAADWHRRNRLQYSAGGLSVDDLSKEQEYMRAAQTRIEAWKDFVLKKKVQLNIQSVFGTLSSGYRWD